ncbi:hypothetical protein DPMN_111159 [Dreissena polymorpha]|uniref:Uncharacterized protein n=1 Tax=Dreissena polymorpha TaxID=45954 RepID=A0A9D4KDD6_DREPO|nr:hypothetical protein DPMN_111159 [Dreissena polymorpha]
MGDNPGALDKKRKTQGAGTGCPASAVVSTLASHLGDPGSIPVPGACEFGWWSPYRTGGVSSGYSGFPPQHKTTLKLKIFQ